MSSANMPQRLKDRWKVNRMAAFARSDSDARINYDGAEPMPSHPENPPAQTSEAPVLPSREEVAELARIPLPRNLRRPIQQRETDVPDQRSSQPLPQPPRGRPPNVIPPSPSKRIESAQLIQQPRANPDENRMLDLFAGSELGENFMNSGRTTPQTVITEHEDIQEKPMPGDKQAVIKSEAPNINAYDRGFVKNKSSFQIRENGFMTVVSGSRHQPSHMNDRFYPGAADGQLAKYPDQYPLSHGRPSSPFEHQAKLPVRGMREVKIRKPPHSGRLAVNGVKHESRPISPTFDKPRRQKHYGVEERQLPVYEESLDGGEYEEPEEEVQVTPKPQRTRPATRKIVLENPIPSIESAAQSFRGRKRARGNPDYDDRVLSSMTFTELQKEPFDFDPTTAAAQSAHGAGPGDISQRLEQCREQGVAERRQAFAAMSMDDWEAAGDWFVDQFADIMHKLRDVRRNKRRLVQKFEQEAADHEEAVRLRLEAIDRKLGKMRQDGQRVVDDKVS